MKSRKPLALANWKMAMTLAQTRTFAREFAPLVEDAVERMDIVLCPPYTALHTLAQALQGTGIHVGAQNLHPGPGVAFTGEISASLLADAGCGWVMLGHWERRRHFGETDADVNRKVRAALDAGLRPIILVGEPTNIQNHAMTALAEQLGRVLADCAADEIGRMAFIYEPEWAIGMAEPAAVEHVARGCAFIREWLRDRDERAAAQARIIYGGSVTPEHAPALLAHADIDGLGAGRKGRDPRTFAAIVNVIAAAKAANADEKDDETTGR